LSSSFVKEIIGSGRWSINSWIYGEELTEMGFTPMAKNPVYKPRTSRDQWAELNELNVE
jgi:hypothetical protein